MSEGGASSPSGIYGHVYKDVKEAGKRLARPMMVHAERRRLIASIRPDLAHHDKKLTDLVDYVTWHEQRKDWEEGNGLLTAATLRELNYIWGRPERFALYEAGLLRFRRAGGEVRRTFVIDSHITDRASYYTLYRVLMRHEALGFSPHIISDLDASAARAQVGVACHTMASFNSRVCYLIKELNGQDPAFLRSLDPRLVSKVQDVVSNLWEKESYDVSWFLKNYPLEIPNEITRLINDDIAAIETLASDPRAKHTF